MAKQTRKNKSKEEILGDIKRKEEISRKRDIVVNRVYPALKEATVSVAEAQMLIQAINTSMMEQVLGWMKEKQFAQLIPNLLERLCPDGVRRDEVLKLLTAVENDNVFVAKEILGGMENVLSQVINDDLKTRKLDDLPVDWDKMLN